MNFYERLDSYFEMFSAAKKLKIKEAKELATKIKICENEKDKNKLYEDLLMGTIHQLYKFIKENDLLFLCENGFVEFDDLISSLTLAWAENLDDRLLAVGRYDTLFSRDYFECVAEKLGIEDLSDSLKIRSCGYLGALASYYRDKDNDNSLSPYFDYTFASGTDCTSERKKKTISVIEKGYQLYKDNCFVNSDNTALLGFYGMIFTSYILNEGSYDRADTFLFDEVICEKLDIDDIISDSFIISEQQREVLIQRFGFDGLGERTLEEVGLNMGLTKSRINQICKDSFKRLRKNIK